ncbi:hypothetical protein [Halomicrobium sp. LC1Hm]|uniref:DUF5789 family protein n=1 Tax=Halomicrobium sp. LC1Hm TaxID=2610902 RepID=UPI0012985386|nr:hypothetical protein [Halomicrobium sp. LC1Hm]QGA81440.1 Uncharacterized protein LC1Hm_0376 [Halomicrobium sp. LC1Hm]
MSQERLTERNDLRAYLDAELSYPVTLSTVRDRLGQVTVIAPDSDESETLASIVEHVDDDSYESADELFETVVSRLPDAYIGRKYYDDRGSTLAVAGSAEDESL